MVHQVLQPAAHSCIVAECENARSVLWFGGSGGGGGGAVVVTFFVQCSDVVDIRARHDKRTRSIFISAYLSASALRCAVGCTAVEYNMHPLVEEGWDVHAWCTTQAVRRRTQNIRRTVYENSVRTYLRV